MRHPLDGVGLRRHAHEVARLPSHLARGGVDRDDGLLHRRLGLDTSGPRRRVVDRQHQRTLVIQNLVGELALRVRRHRPPRRRVQSRQRRIEAQRHVDAIADGHQPSCNVRGVVPSAVPVRVIAPLTPAPLGDRPFPQERTVERITGDECPPVGHTVDAGQGLIDDRQQPTPRRDHRTDAGRSLVVPLPARLGNPLHAPRRADHRVPCHRVAVRPVQPMRPFVDFFRPRLDRLDPFVSFSDARHATRTQHAHHLVHSRRAGTELLGHDEVHEVIDVRQPLTVPPINRHLPIQSQRPDMLAGHDDVGLGPCQAVHPIGIPRLQRGRHLPIDAPDANDQPALDPRRPKNLLRLFLRRRIREGRTVRRRQAHQQAHQPQPSGASPVFAHQHHSSSHSCRDCTTAIPRMSRSRPRVRLADELARRVLLCPPCLSYAPEKHAGQDPPLNEAWRHHSVIANDRPFSGRACSSRSLGRHSGSCPARSTPRAPPSFIRTLAPPNHPKRTFKIPGPLHFPWFFPVIPRFPTLPRRYFKLALFAAISRPRRRVLRRSQTPVHALGHPN